MLLENIVTQLTGHLEPVVLAGLLVNVVAFEVEMRKVEGDAVLGWRYDFPDAVLVAWVSLGERGAGDCTVVRIEYTTAGICSRKKKNLYIFTHDVLSRVISEYVTFAMFPIRVKLVANLAGTLVSSQSVDAVMLAAVVCQSAFVKL